MAALSDFEITRLTSLETELPFWEFVTPDNAACLSLPQLHQWLTLCLLRHEERAKNELCAPWKAFYLKADHKLSKLVTNDWYDLSDFKERQVCDLTLTGEWLVELINGVVLGLGIGTAAIELTQTRADMGYDSYGEIQKGFIEFEGQSLRFVGWMKRELFMNHLAMLGRTVCDNDLVLEFSNVIPVLGHEVEPKLFFSVSCSAGCSSIKLHSGMVEPNLSHGGSEFVLSMPKPRLVSPALVKAIAAIKGDSVESVTRSLTGFSDDGTWDFYFTEDLVEALQHEHALRKLGIDVYTVGIGDAPA